MALRPSWRWRGQSGCILDVPDDLIGLNRIGAFALRAGVESLKFVVGAGLEVVDEAWRLIRRLCRRTLGYRPGDSNGADVPLVIRTDLHLVRCNVTIGKSRIGNEPASCSMAVVAHEGFRIGIRLQDRDACTDRCRVAHRQRARCRPGEKFFVGIDIQRRRIDTGLVADRGTGDAVELHHRQRAADPDTAATARLQGE